MLDFLYREQMCCCAKSTFSRCFCKSIASHSTDMWHLTLAVLCGEKNALISVLLVNCCIGGSKSLQIQIQIQISYSKQYIVIGMK